MPGFCFGRKVSYLQIMAILLRIVCKACYGEFMVAFALELDKFYSETGSLRCLLNCQGVKKGLCILFFFNILLIHFRQRGKKAEREGRNIHG